MINFSLIGKIAKIFIKFSSRRSLHRISLSNHRYYNIIVSFISIMDSYCMNIRSGHSDILQTCVRSVVLILYIIW